MSGRDTKSKYGDSGFARMTNKNKGNSKVESEKQILRLRRGMTIRGLGGGVDAGAWFDVADVYFFE